MPPLHILLATSLLALSARAWAQTPLASGTPLRPSIATSPGWALEPKDFLGIKLGKPVADQTAVRPCDSVAYDKNLFCFVDAPVFTHFRNMPDIGFAYEVVFLTSGPGPNVDGVQLTFDQAHEPQAFTYALRNYGAPTGIHQIQWDKHRAGGRMYIWAGPQYFMSLVERGPDPDSSVLTIVTNERLNRGPGQ